MPTNTSTSDARIIFLVCFFITLSFFSIDLINPALPSIMYHFNTDADHIQAIVLVYSLGIGLSQFVYGPLSDRFGRRTIVFIGASICLMGNVFAACATSLTHLMIARFVGAFGSGAGIITARVVLRDRFSGIKLLKSFSYLSMAINISPALAPVLGGVIQQTLGWRWTFIFLSMWAVILLISLAYGLPETLPKEKRLTQLSLNTMLTAYCSLIRNRTFLHSTLLSGTCLAIGLTYLLMSPFLYQLVLGLSPAQNGFVYIANAIGFIVGAFSVNYFSTSQTPSKLVFAGLLSCLLGSVSLLAIGLCDILNIWVLILPTSVNSAGIGLIMPAASSITFSSLNVGTGMAAALLGGIRLLIVTLCLVLVLFVPEHNQIPMGTLLVLFAGISLLIYWRLSKAL